MKVTLDVPDFDLSRPTVLFDFDGTISTYENGWEGVDTINDPPVPGIAKVIADVRAAGIRVLVHSTRCHQAGGMDAIRAWLAVHEIEVDGLTPVKVPALVSVDDRAMTFEPRLVWQGLVERIRNFQSWVDRG